jgi:histidine ammonia-lyase
MATFAARRLQPMLRNSERIIAIELLAAAQGIEFLRPLRSAPVIEDVLRLVRSCSPAMMQDRSLALDIEALHHLVEAGEIGHVARAAIAPLAELRLV